MLEIDGSMGEGGGQVLRTSLALAMMTGRTFHLHSIRANRPKPGLMRQHLTAVTAAAEVCGAVVRGAEIGSRALWFKPGTVRAGNYSFAVGTAGSATLVLQTVLPALLHADAPSTVAVEGGTHNPMAPPFEFLAEAFVPLLNRMGPQVSVRLERHGFAPAGGGRVVMEIAPAPLRPLVLEERGEPEELSARAFVAGGLSRDIGLRELKIARQRLHLGETACRVEALPPSSSDSPGNVFFVTARFAAATEVFSGIGQKGTSAEKVAERACREAEAFLAGRAAVGEHLADQLLLPTALAGRGSFTTLPPTLHTRTNAEVIRLFLPVDIRLRELESGCWRVELGKSV